MDDEDSEQLHGAMAGVTRIGRTVHRESGPWSPAVHELLAYLKSVRFKGVPNVKGYDNRGREVLTYVDGRGVPVDDEVVLDEVLVGAVTWLREYHDVVDGFRPEGIRTWRGGPDFLEDHQIICHNDPGAYNWIIQSGRFVAMIDWDMAGPGQPIDDLAFMLWTGIPLYRDIGPEESARRLELAAEAYGEYGPLQILRAVETRMLEAARRIQAGIDIKDPGILNLQKIGEPQRTRDRVAAFVERRDAIAAALG